MAWPAADVDDGPALGRLTAGYSFFETDQHRAPEQSIGHSFERPIVVAVDGIEVDRVTVEKLRRAPAPCIGCLCEIYFSKDVT